MSSSTNHEESKELSEESNLEKGQTSEDNHFEFTEDEGAQFVNESILKQRLVNGKKQFLLKLSSGTVTRTQSPNQRDFTDKLFRKWTKTGEKGRSDIENPKRTKTKSKRSKSVRVYNGTCISSLSVSRLATFFNKKNDNKKHKFLGETSKLSK